jgi:hypothetical protein
MLSVELAVGLEWWLTPGAGRLNDLHRRNTLVVVRLRQDGSGRRGGG